MTAGSLAGRHALVTGASGGIGQAVVKALLGAGAAVTLAGRDPGRLESFAATLEDAPVHLAPGFDVTDRAAIEAGLVEARAALGPVSILVNNAGAAPTAPFERMDAASWSSVLETNLTSVFIVTAAIIAELRAFGPAARVVNMASTAGLVGYRYVSAYCAAKHGLVGLTRALALEYAGTGPTVNAVCPGFTDTPLIAGALDRLQSRSGRERSDLLAEFTRMNPQGRLVTPEEVAASVLFLCLPTSSAITGQAIAVAGGEVMAG